MHGFSKNLGLMGNIAVWLVICCCSLSAQDKYDGGTGEPNDPYQIANANDLLELGTTPDDYDKHFILTDDVNMVGYTLTTAVIAADTDNTNDDFDGIPFTGVFDGAGHRILNLTIDSVGDNYFLGLIGFVHGEKAQVRNLGLGSVSITITGGNSSRCLGGLCGRNNGTISNCYSTGSLTGIYGAGGLVGYNTFGTISNCYSKASVSGERLIGGLVGINGGTITNCCSSGTVSGTSWQVGGLVGDNRGTITNSYSTDSVSGIRDVGGLVGDNSGGTITNCYAERGSVSSSDLVGGLCGNNWGGTITNCYSTTSVSGTGSVVGGLVGRNYQNGTITNSYAKGGVSGNVLVGGLVGRNYHNGTITNSYSTGSVAGDKNVGGLVGANGVWYNPVSAITNCYSTGSFVGSTLVGGLVGDNRNLIRNCYSSGIVSGSSRVGGLIGIHRMKEVINCYSKGGVTGNDDVGGLVGYYNDGSYTKCFWNNTVNSGLSGIGNTTDPNVIGESTTNMQIEKTFTDAGWDFNTPLWTIDEGKYYPRLWWEFEPVLYAEPEVTLETSNTISWGPVYIAVECYAECSEDANFTSIIYNSGWITESSYEFTGLQLGQRYWYSVKARNAEGVESQWSNVESSLQGTLDDVVDAVEILLDPNNLKSKNLKKALINKINEALEMIEEGLYKDAMNKLEHDILQKTNGCAETGEPDKNDWIITCEQQNVVYPLVIETIEYVNDLMEQSAR